MKKIRIHVFISGRVQGVGFRYSTLDQAQKLGLSGWVRNTSDGKVEAVFEGSEDIVENMLSWCYKGPQMSHVINVQVHRGPYTGEFQGFSIIR